MRTRFTKSIFAALMIAGGLPVTAVSQTAGDIISNTPSLMIAEKDEGPQLRLTLILRDHDSELIVGTPTTLRADQRVFSDFDVDRMITRTDEAAIKAEINARFSRQNRTNRPETGLRFTPDPSMFFHQHGESRLAIGQDAIRSNLSTDF